MNPIATTPISASHSVHWDYSIVPPPGIREWWADGIDPSDPTTTATAIMAGISIAPPTTRQPPPRFAPIAAGDICRPAANPPPPTEVCR